MDKMSLEQIPGNKNKTNQDKSRELLALSLGLDPDTATDAQLFEAITGQHKEFNLEDYKKKEDSPAKVLEEQRLENLAEPILRESRKESPLKNKLEFSPARVRNVNELAVGRKYRIHSESTKRYYDVVVDTVPYPKEGDFYVRFRSLLDGATKERSCRELGIVSKEEASEENVWKRGSFWVQPLDGQGKKSWPPPEFGEDEDEGRGAD